MRFSEEALLGELTMPQLLLIDIGCAQRQRMMGMKMASTMNCHTVEPTWQFAS